jgi:hypothetical protein
MVLAIKKLTMEFKQETIDEIIESEKQMVLTGADRYGTYFANASQFNDLLQHFIKSVDPDRFIFAMFLAQIRKHTTLALFSALRLHHLQTMMDLRQVLEAAACAAYAIANPDVAGFADVDDDGVADTSQELTKRRYKWLEENFKLGSDAIKNMKTSINASSAHSNIVYAYNNFRFDEEKGNFSTPFFDIEDDYLVKTNLWQIGNIIMGITDLLYGVNRNIGSIKFIPEFIPRLKALEIENNKLKAEMMSTDRYQRSKVILDKIKPNEA